MIDINKNKKINEMLPNDILLYSYWYLDQLLSERLHPAAVENHSQILGGAWEIPSEKKEEGLAHRI